MHEEMNRPDISKVYAYVFRPVKSSMRTLYKHISLKLMVSLSICANERKRSSRLTCFDRPHVCPFGNNVLITERYDWFCFPANSVHLHFITTSLNNRRQLNDNDLRPNSFCWARSKNFSLKLRAYYRHLRENIYNVICTICKCCSRCELKINFQNVYPPAQTWRPPMEDLWRRFCPGPQTRWRIRGQLPLNLFCAPQILLCSETVLAPKKAFCSPKP